MIFIIECFHIAIVCISLKSAKGTVILRLARSPRRMLGLLFFLLVLIFIKSFALTNNACAPQKFHFVAIFGVPHFSLLKMTSALGTFWADAYNLHCHKMAYCHSEWEKLAYSNFSIVRISTLWTFLQTKHFMFAKNNIKIRILAT